MRRRYKANALDHSPTMPPSKPSTKVHPFMAAKIKVFSRIDALRSLEPFVPFCKATCPPGREPKFAHAGQPEIHVQDVVGCAVIRLAAEMVPHGKRGTGSLAESAAAVLCFLRRAPDAMRDAGFDTALAVSPTDRFDMALQRFVQWGRAAKLSIRDPKSERDELLQWLWLNKVFPIAVDLEAGIREAVKLISGRAGRAGAGAFVSEVEVLQQSWIHPDKQVYVRGNDGAYKFDAERLRDLFSTEARRAKRMSVSLDATTSQDGSCLADSFEARPEVLQTDAKDALEALEAVRTVMMAKARSKDARAIYKHLPDLIQGMKMAEVARLERLSEGNLSKKWATIRKGLAQIPEVSALITKRPTSA